MKRIYRYHYKLGFPTNLKAPTEPIHIKTYSQHALRAAENDRYAPSGIKLPKVVNPRRAKLIECDALADGTVLKTVYRVPYDMFDRDIVMVVNVETNTLITVWLNERSDKHTTLRAEQYDLPLAR